MAERTIVYTDGACLGNPGKGGWAWLVPDGPYASGAEQHTTNQRMELTAVLEALKTVEGPVEVISDSAYVVNCFRDRWWRLDLPGLEDLGESRSPTVTCGNR